MRPNVSKYDSVSSNGCGSSSTSSRWVSMGGVLFALGRAALPALGCHGHGMVPACRNACASSIVLVVVVVVVVVTAAAC